MPKAKPRSPGVGHNSDATPPDVKDMMIALAVKVLDEEEKGKMMERHKLHSKAAQGKRVTAEDIKEMFAMRDLTGAELEQKLNRMILRMGAVNPDLGQQLDIFVPKATKTQKAAYRQTGMMAAIKGLAFTPPPGLAGDSLQEMLDGWNDGAAYRKAAENERLDEMRKAIKKAEEEDARSAASAAEVNRRAAEDFAKDNGADPQIFRGEKYPSVKAANAARKQWIIDHPGEDPEPKPVAADGEVNAGAAPRDTIYTLSSDEPFASGRLKTYRNGLPHVDADEGEYPVYDAHPAEEIVDNDPLGIGQTEGALQPAAPTPAPQTAEKPDEDEVKAAAEKLAKSDFVPPPKKTRAKPAGKLN